MTSVQQGTLRVPGGSIFYRSCGRGRPLLILTGGGADADTSAPLRDALADRFRVITLDRRGLSRSAMEPGAAMPSIRAHADDVHRLLAELTDEPAYVFGSGIGGLIGLDLVARRPEQVRLLVAHEAPSAELLPEREREALTLAQQTILRTFRDEGLAAAMRRSAECAGIDPEDREPDISPPPMDSRLERNMAFLLSSDTPQAIAYRLDVPALDVQARKIVPAAGRSTRHSLLHRCAAALAETLERPLAPFPGGHTGWLLRPKAFAAQLAETCGRNDRLDRRLDDRPSPRAGGRP